MYIKDEGVKEMKKILLGLTAILLIGLLAACSEDEDTEKKEEDKVTTVETESIEQGDLVMTKSFYGRAEPNKTTPVMLPSAGEIDSLEVEEGDQVEEDNTLAKLKTPAGTESIKAPEDGRIINLDAEEDDKVSGDDPLAIVADLDKMKVTYEITSTNHSLFKKDDEQKAEYDDKEYDAKVKKVGSTPGETGLFSVEVELDETENNILSGSIVKLDVPENRVKDSLLVPTEAIFDEDDESFIFIVKDDEVTKVKVEIKESQTEQTAIESEDVKKDDEVIIKGQLTLTDGDKVNVVEAGE